MIRKKDLVSLLVSLKKDIDDDYKAEGMDTPSMDVTVGWNPESDDWSYQTGDNSFMGSAYHYPCWAVVTLTRRSNSRELADDILDQLAEYAD